MDINWPDPQSFPAGSRWAAIVADLPGLVEDLKTAWSVGDYSAAKTAAEALVRAADQFERNH